MLATSVTSIRTGRALRAFGALGTLGSIRTGGTWDALRTDRTGGALGALGTVSAGRALGTGGAVRPGRAVAHELGDPRGVDQGDAPVRTVRARWFLRHQDSEVVDLGQEPTVVGHAEALQRGFGGVPTRQRRGSGIQSTSS